MTPQKVLISTCFWPLRHISLKQRARPATTLLNTSKKLDVLSIPWVYPSIESSFKFGEVPSFQWLFVQSFWAFSCSKYSTFAWRCLRQVKSIVDGNQKILRRFTSWGKGSWNPIIYKGFQKHPRWLGMGFLNHQQYVVAKRVSIMEKGESLKFWNTPTIYKKIHLLPHLRGIYLFLKV